MKFAEPSKVHRKSGMWGTRRFTLWIEFEGWVLISILRLVSEIEFVGGSRFHPSICLRGLFFGGVIVGCERWGFGQA